MVNLSFHNSSSFDLKILFNVKRQGHKVTHPLLPMMRAVKFCIVFFIVFHHNLLDLYSQCGTHVKKINGISDGRVTGITNIT
jgi:hypothetical protein